ncbi:MAG TPA: DUF4388 domain-containing protein [Pyrinomonadaceae bacterium]|nr:DUF4388 domain-containing protein [Pyrinomonadaceae bacterium]
MALTGQLSDMSLAELIEFFCNQRKTGRLKVDYHHGHGVFFIKEGELVDAKVGSLTGAEAVYFALTLPNAAFDFSGEVEPPRRTIEESWKHVVLEGLRRLDEGISPRQSDAFGPDWTPSDADLALLMDRIERLDAGGDDAGDGLKTNGDGVKTNDASAKDAPDVEVEREPAAPLSMMVESASAGGAGGRKKLYVFGALACVVLICAVASVPVVRRMRANNQPAPAAAPAVQPEATQGAAAEAPASEVPAEAAPDVLAAEDVTPQPTDPAAAAALAARRERERERAARERRLEEARKNEAADKSGETSTDASKPAAPVVSGPKVVRVSVSYDEQGRVTQASVAGATPGAEAYGGTAVRIARGRRFPAGKAGGTVITIPVNENETGRAAIRRAARPSLSSSDPQWKSHTKFTRTTIRLTSVTPT